MVMRHSNLLTLAVTTFFWGGQWRGSAVRGYRGASESKRDAALLLCDERQEAIHLRSACWIDVLCVL